MSSTKSQGDFDEALNTIQSEFLDGGKEGESDESLADGLIDYVLKRERARQGVDRNPEKWAEVDRVTMDRMKNWDSSDLSFAAVEKVQRKLASNEGAAGVKLLGDDVANRAKALSTKQSGRGKKPRRKNPITLRIEEIVAANPKITENELFIKLAGEVGHGIIESYIADEFSPADPTFRTIKRGGLGNQLNRAKKSLK
jgi:hypothetical protein